MFKFLFELILSTILIFFVWNILKRIFLKTFYPIAFQRNERQEQAKQAQKEEKKKSKRKENLNWDAETVEYEEIKDNK
ncbi:hypothetical protein [Elizabethkingia sp. JS20170427COW]|uniref:hypothetical protein n=1 Tax=Elizabethkingia sp. JS20170427COW TaxID=2583851 RepID=UPI001110F064|nr:hypothetical protein [Elizabethkingia sp. JS20170427COW]QCX53926.1 hypothetical protein FGE20_09370 [Elizabethkingia sp. JS20170427COW]